MAGFLLQQDAVDARRFVFDDWVNEQKRAVEQAAQAAQQAAAQELQARQDAIARAIAASAPPTPPEPLAAPPTPAPAPVYAPPSTPEVQERAQLFAGWVAQQQALQDLLANAEPPGKLHGGGFNAPLAEGAGRFFEGLGTDIRRQQSEAQAINPYLAGVPGGGFSDVGTALTAGLEDAGVPSPYRELAGGGLPFLLPSGAARTAAGGVAREAPSLAQRLLRSGMPTGAARDFAEELVPPPETGVSAMRAALTQRELGQVSPMVAARLAGAAAGGYAGYQSTPEDAGPVERIGRTVGGAGAVFATPGIVEAAITRPQIQQDILESLRRGGVVGGPPLSTARTNLTGELVDLTKQGMLSNPVSRIVDLVGNTIELLRQPIALTMGGRGPEAGAGLAALARAIPEAAQNAADVLFRGQQAATLGQGAQHTRARDLIFKILGAGDMFTRTLGEYQGMAAKGVQMLNEAGIPLGTPQAEQFLAQHADELYREGAQSGTGSVFGAVQRGQHASALDQLMSKFADLKESKLNSPNKRDQAVGALLDLAVPFSGVPSRVWQIGIQRVPGITQVAGVARIGRALQQGDSFAAQKALGEVTLESMIQAQIAQGIRDGFITGPDDPEHPSSVQLNGKWLPQRSFGVYGAPMGIMAAFAERWEKTGREADPEVTDRFGAALNASMEPLVEALPGFTMLQTLAGLGRGGATRALTDTVADAATRLMSPALGAWAENLVDPVVRDVATRGSQQLWEPAFAKNPLLARFLPPKLDPTTGEPMRRGVSPLGGATRPSSPVLAELARLKRMGYVELSLPTDKPQSVYVRGKTVPVKDGTPEQRAMVAASGKFLAEIGEQMAKPSYARMSDDQKATFWSRMIDRGTRLHARAWLENVDPAVGAKLLSAGKRVLGRRVDEDETERINREVAMMTQLRRQRKKQQDEEERTSALRQMGVGLGERR